MNNLVAAAKRDINYIDLSPKVNKEINLAKRLFSDIGLQLKKNNFPILILSDSLPEIKRLENSLDQLFKQGINPGDVILVIAATEMNNKGASLEMLKTGIKDIYYWAGEDDFKDYIIFTIQRRQKVNTVLESALVKDNLVGESVAWKNFLSKLVEAALFSQCSFLLMGESGTGKELLSRLIHTIDTRAGKKDLVLLDCTTIVPELSGSEFFGHERGSYTNAMQSREGAFALANGGTLFLDEIGELHLPLQAELLRVIQEGAYKKVGSNHWLQTSFRLVCATHRNLRSQVAENKFRQDLFFRISDFEFKVPSLEERREDIPLLANYFLKQFCKENEPVEFDNSVLDFLLQRSYPGNVRELRQLLQRIALRHVRHKKISIGELPEEEWLSDVNKRAGGEFYSLETVIKKMLQCGETYNSIKDKAGLAAFEAAIEMSNGNKQKAAERLGIDVRTVQMGMKKQLSK